MEVIVRIYTCKKCEEPHTFKDRLCWRCWVNREIDIIYEVARKRHWTRYGRDLPFYTKIWWCKNTECYDWLKGRYYAARYEAERTDPLIEFREFVHLESYRVHGLSVAPVHKKITAIVDRVEEEGRKDARTETDTSAIHGAEDSGGFESDPLDEWAI